MNKGICLVNLQHPEDKYIDLKIGDPIEITDRTQFEWLISIGSIQEVQAKELEPAKPVTEKAKAKAAQSAE